jgi:hypothetical protein
VWIERDGLVAIECEGVSPNGWAVETTVPGFLGNGYFHHTGSGGEVIYTVLITTPGIYRIAIRNFHDHPDSTLSNDCFLGVDGGTMKKCFSGKKDAWNWYSTLDHQGKKEPPLYDLQPGLHRIHMSGRSTGFRVDRIHCYLEGNKAGNDDHQPESTVLPQLDDLEEGSLYAKAYAAGAAGVLLATAERAKDDDAVAKRVREACLAEIALRLAACETLRSEWPLGAAESLSQIGQLWSPSKAGKELITKAKEWSRTPEAKQAAVAYGLLTTIEPTAKRLIELNVRADDPKAKTYQRDLMNSASTAARLERDHAGSPQAKQVRSWCRELGIPN